MLRHAQGIDESEVVTFHEPRSVSQETTFARDVQDGAALRKELAELAAGAGRRLRNTGYLGATVKLKLRWSDFTTITRQATLPAPTDRDADILEAALALFEKAWPPNRPVRLIGVGVSGLKPPMRQLTLWEAGGAAAAAEAQAEVAIPSQAKPTRPAKGAAEAFPLHPTPEQRRRLDEAVALLEQRYGKPVVRRGVVAKKETGADDGSENIPGPQ
jgi:DNA polymerase-4